MEKNKKNYVYSTSEKLHTNSSISNNYDNAEKLQVKGKQ